MPWILKLAVGVVTMAFATAAMSTQPRTQPVSTHPASRAISQPVSESLSRIDISGWKIYRNEAMGFEVQYPSSWQLRIAGGFGPESVSLDETPQAGKSNLSVQFKVQRLTNPKDLSIEKWIAGRPRGDDAALPPTTSTLMGGRPTVRREIVGISGRHFDFFSSLNKTDVLQVTIVQPTSQAPLNRIYEQVLSTVKFTE